MRTALCLVVVAVAVVVAAWHREDARSPGEILFRTKFTAQTGLGPLFNERACSSCHLQPRAGGVGRHGLATVVRVGKLTAAGFDPLLDDGGPVARAHRTPGCGGTPGIPAAANVTSVRNTPPLFGTGLIDAIPDRVIRAGAAAQRGDGIRGRPSLIRGTDGHLRVGRFGWKADQPTLDGMVALALHTELGITSALAAGGRCDGDGPEIDHDALADLTAYVAELAPPAPRAPARVFKTTGCAACHVPSLPAGERDAHLYSDLLIHDMGRDLDDRVDQGPANGRDWRTTPLWGLGTRPRYLHDGRARTLEAAILAHAGEATTAQRRYRSLPDRDRRTLLNFLRTL